MSQIEKLAGIDLRSLAAFRIGLGAILVWDLCDALAGVSLFYTDAGAVPREVLARVRESGWLWSLHTLSGAAWWQVVLIVLHLVAALCLIAGWRTQLVAVVSWVLLCSLQARNPLVLHGGDTVLRVMSFWAMLLPLGARWSADERRGIVSCFAERGFVFSAASMALLLQVAMIYWFTAMLKYGAAWTRDGTAVYYAMSADQFATSAGVWLLQFPALCRALSFGTVWLEVLGPFVAFIPWRTARWRVAVVFCFCAFHLGLAVCLRLGPFPWMMMVAWLPFLPAAFWERSCSGARQRSDGRAHGWMRSAPVQVFALACLAIVLLWNLRTRDVERWEKIFPRSANAIAYVPRLEQYWALFAPKPLTDDGWPVLDATLRDGSHIDLIRAGRALTWEKPASISAEFRDVKWQKLELALWLARFEPARRPFAEHLAARWNAGRLPEKHVVSWTLSYMREETLPLGYAFTPQRVELAKSAD